MLPAFGQQGALVQVNAGIAGLQGHGLGVVGQGLVIGLPLVQQPGQVGMGFCQRGCQHQGFTQAGLGGQQVAIGDGAVAVVVQGLGAGLW